MCNPISFEPISFINPPNIPSKLDEGVWDNIGWATPSICNIPPFPQFTMPSCIKIPDIIKPLPPLLFGQSVPKISIDWCEPPQISCVLLVRSPGTNEQEWLNAREKAGLYISTEEKCVAIVRHTAGKVDNFKSFVDEVYESIKMQPGTSDIKTTDDSSVERE